MRILVTRPAPDDAKHAAALRARGHDPVLSPLFDIKFEQPRLDLDGVQALVVTSRNALRALALHPHAKQLSHLPLFTVGEATTTAASELGFAQVTTGPGKAAGLAERLRAELDPANGALLHLAGGDLAFDLCSALPLFELRQPVLYRAVPAAALPEEVSRALKTGKIDAAILMSPRSAEIFVSLLRKEDAMEPGSRLICYCLSEAVAEAASPLGSRLRVAATPQEEDILALIDSDAASL